MTKTYKHCPQCRRRMKQVSRQGETGYEWIDYSCPCGYCWTWDTNGNVIHRGRSEDYILETLR